MIRLLVCDDHHLVRASLVYALQQDPRFDVAAQVFDSAQLLTLLGEAPAVDVLLLDLNLDARGAAAGIELIERIQAMRLPLAILVLSVHDDAQIVSRALDAGAKGYVTKDSTLDILQGAIVQVSLGHYFLAPRLIEPMVRPRAPAADSAWDAALTAREREVLRLICSGQRLNSIAAALGVSVKTISTHKARLMVKLNVSSNAELIKLSMRGEP